MSHQEYLKQIESEIRSLNRIIDYKILNKQKYQSEAKRHKLLLDTINKHQFKSENKIRSVAVKSNFFGKFMPSIFAH